MTRTHLKNWRAYVNGVDMSGVSRQIGALNWMFDAEPDAALTDAVKNILIGKGDIQAGPLNAFLENDAAALFANQSQALRYAMFAMGANAAPAAGDPVFAWAFEDVGYKVEPWGIRLPANQPHG